MHWGPRYPPKTKNNQKANKSNSATEQTQNHETEKHMINKNTKLTNLEGGPPSATSDWRTKQAGLGRHFSRVGGLTNDIERPPVEHSEESAVITKSESLVASKGSEGALGR